MRKLIFGLIFCLISSVAMALESDSSVVFKASFLKNELQSFKISRLLYTLTKADTTSTERIEFNADVYVKDSTENYYLLTWKFSNFSIKTENEYLKKLIALAKPVEVSYKTTKPGVFMEFLNGKNVLTCLEGAMPKVMAPFLNKKGKDDQVNVAAIYDMRETIETLMLRSIIQFHQVYGLGYTLGEVVDVPTVLNSRFSSTPINGVIRKKLTRIDPVNHLAVLSTATYFDKKEYQKALSSYLKLNSVSGIPAVQDNIGSVVVDLNTGWVLWTFDQSETKMGDILYGELVDIVHISAGLKN